MKDSGDATRVVVHHDLMESSRHLVESPGIGGCEIVKGSEGSCAGVSSTAQDEGDGAAADHRTGARDDSCACVHRSRSWHEPLVPARTVAIKRTVFINSSPTSSVR